MVLVFCLMASNLPIHVFATGSDTGLSPSGTAAQASESQATEPQATETQATESQITEPQATESQVTEPQATKLQTTVPQTTTPQDTPVQPSARTSSQIVTSAQPRAGASDAEIEVVWPAGLDPVDLSGCISLYRQDGIAPINGWHIRQVSNNKYQITNIPINTGEDLRMVLTSPEGLILDDGTGLHIITLKYMDGQYVPQASIFVQSAKRSALFSICWDDLENASQRRPADAHNMIGVYLTDNDDSTEDILLSDARITVFDASDPARTICLIEELPAKLDAGMSMILKADISRLSGYQLTAGGDSDAYPTLTPVTGESYALKADKDFILTLPQYDFGFSISGLDAQAEEEFAFSVTCGGEPYTTFQISDGKIKGLFCANAEGEAAEYILTWPQEIAGLVCSTPNAQSFTVNADGELKLAYEEKFQVPADTVTSSLEVTWFDATANYTHKGQLILSVPVSANGKTIPVTPAWNGSQYTYRFTAEDLQALGISSNESDLALLADLLPALTVSDEGKSTDRTHTATAPAMITVPGTEPGTRMPLVNFTLGTIQVKDVDFSPAANSVVQDYAIGTAIDGSGRTTLYPMTEVGFKFDIRSGDDDSLNILNNLYAAAAIRLRLFDSDTGAWIDSPIAAGYFEDTYGITDISTALSDIQGPSYGRILSYSLLLPYYDVNQRPIAYAFNSASGDQVDSPFSTDDWYRLEYDNTAVPGHGTHIDQAYEDGTMIFTLTGIRDFSVSKVWADDCREETAAARPSARFSLWRYTSNGGDYTSSAMVQIPLADGTYTDYLTVDTTQDSYTVTLPTVLDKYDSDGYPYVYFFREDLQAHNYEKIYGIVSEGPTGSNNVTDNVPYSGGRYDDDSSIYDGSTITNHITLPITLTATMEWKAAYYQNNLDDLKATLTLKAQHKYPIGDEEFDAPFVVSVFELDQFDAFHVYQTVSTGQDLYDSHGHELVYWWELSSVTEISDPATGEGTTRQIGTTLESNPISQTFPMNEATIAQDSYSPSSTEHFTFSAELNEFGDTHFTGLLEGTTEYWLKKSWSSSMPRSTVSFSLRLMNENGEVSVPGDEDFNSIYTIPADSPYYHGTQVSDWIQAYSGLPKYDEDGNRLSYVMTEVGGKFYAKSSYGRDVDADDVIEANSLYIHNSQDPGVGRMIDVRKIWLDDSAATDRGPVYVHVYTEDGQLVYGTEGNNKGLIDEDPLIITATNEWMLLGVGVTLFHTENGLSPTIDIPEGETEYNYKLKNLYQGGYYIKEIAISTPDNTLDASYVTPAGYSTITNGDTRYVVSYSGSDPIHCANSPDAEGYYTITNLRIGSVNMAVTKNWLDDGTIDRSCFNATVTVSCTDDTSRLTDGEDNLGYAQVATTVYPNGKQPITGGDDGSIPVGTTQAVPTDADTVTVAFYGLPLYDEVGRILHYEIVERTSGSDPSNPGSYTIASTPVEYTQTNEPGVILGTQNLTNTFQNMAPVYFDLLWLDGYRIEGSQRPDVYLHLYNTVHTYDDSGEIIDTKIVRHSFLEYKWSGTNNEKKTEDWWRYTFPSLPEYDQYGNRITYYATLNSHANTDILDYLDPQFAASDAINSYEAFAANAMSSVSFDEESGRYVVSHDTSQIVNGLPTVGTYQKDSETLYVLKTTNTFVLQLRNDLSIAGHKSWENIPIDFPSGELPLLTFNLYRAEEGIEGDGICVASVPLYQSPSDNFTFTLNYYGINDALGNPVAATADEISAWAAETGLDASLYGTPLPRYDVRGNLYKYTIIEVISNFKGESLRIAYNDLSNTVSGYDVTNVYNITSGNTRPIALEKEWIYNNSPADTEQFDFPAETEFNLYRFFKLDNLNTNVGPAYSIPEQVSSLILTAEMAASGTALNFGDQLVYAPNGNPYIYYLAEKQLSGYNNNLQGFPSSDLASGAFAVSAEDGVSGWPMDSLAEDFWYSQPFALETRRNDANTSAVQITMTNDYTGIDQVVFEGIKVWEDYSNTFLTRPDSLELTLYRKTETLEKEAVATITLAYNEDADPEEEKAVATLSLISGTENVTSLLLNNAPACSFSVNGDQWNFTVSNLDGYASTAEAWVYFVEETVPENYTASNSGISDANNTLTNSIYSSVTFNKVWDGINPGIGNPEILVKLQVSTDGETWMDAASEEAFGRKLEDYTFQKTMNAASGWKVSFQNLPVGSGTGDAFVPFQYRVLEIQIGNAPVTYVDETVNDPTGTTAGGYAATTSGSTVTNSAAVTSLTVAKQWLDDSSNDYRTRGNSADGTWSVGYHIYRIYSDGTDTITQQVLAADGITPFVLTVSGTDEQDTASAAIGQLPAVSPEGYVYTYRAVELNPDGTEVAAQRYNGTYGVTYHHEGSTAEGFITLAENKLIFVEVTVTKIWDDAALSSIRPETLDLILYQNGKDISSSYTAQLDWQNTDTPVWTYSYLSLPKYDTTGNAYTYTVGERVQAGYRSPVILTEEPATEGYFQYTINNSLTHIRLNKVDSADPSVSLNGVTLVFTSTAPVVSAKLGGSFYFQLTWNRDQNGIVTHSIHYGASYDNCTSLWTSGAEDIYGLPEATYRLSDEPKTPIGYYASALNASFALGSTVADGVSTQVFRNVDGGLIAQNEADPAATLAIKNAFTHFQIIKWDENNHPIAHGWVFSVVPANAESTFADGSTEAKIFNAGDEAWVQQLVVDNVYAVTEVDHPTGYIPYTEPVYFLLNNTNTVIITDAVGNAITTDSPATGAANGILYFRNEPNRVQVEKVNEEGTVLSGAVYELHYVSDAEGNETGRQIPNETDLATWIWNSETGTGEAAKLAPGTYKLVEVTPPSGYRIAEDILFIVDDSGIVSIDGAPVAVRNHIPVIQALDTLTRFAFHKLGLVNETCADPDLGVNSEATVALEGVEFTAYSGEALTEPVMTALSDGNGLVEFIGLPLGIHYIQETTAPEGYVLDPAVYVAEVTSDESIILKDMEGNEVENNALINDVFRGDFSFCKVSELDNDQTISGVVFGLYKDDSLIATAQSDESGLVTFSGLLMDVAYTVQELEVPTGCHLSKYAIELQFTMTDGEPQLVITDNGNDTLLETEDMLLWQEPQTSVSILKVGEDRKPLAGATLRILDSDGKTVALEIDGKTVTSWVSGTEAVVFTGQLAAGQTYQLVELNAPEGYQLAQPVEFTVSGDSVAPGEAPVLNVTMTNKKIPVTPSTGDSMNPGFWFTAMITGFLGMLTQITSLQRKRKTLRR